MRDGETKQPLRFAGNDVALIGRAANGKALVCYLDRFGERTTQRAWAWAHELRGQRVHLWQIKQQIEALPVVGPTKAAPSGDGVASPIASKMQQPSRPKATAAHWSSPRED